MEKSRSNYNYRYQIFVPLNYCMEILDQINQIIQNEQPKISVINPIILKRYNGKIYTDSYDRCSIIIRCYKSTWRRILYDIGLYTYSYHACEAYYID